MVCIAVPRKAVTACPPNSRARASGPERCRAWPSPPAPASRRLGAGEEPRGALSLPHADAPVAEGGVDGESAGPNRVSHAQRGAGCANNKRENRRSPPFFAKRRARGTLLKVFVLGFDPADAQPGFLGHRVMVAADELDLTEVRRQQGGASFSFSRVRLASWRD